MDVYLDLVSSRKCYLSIFLYKILLSKMRKKHTKNRAGITRYCKIPNHQDWSKVHCIYYLFKRDKEDLIFLFGEVMEAAGSDMPD